MAGVAARGPGAIALAPLATSPRKGDRLRLSPLSAPPWHNRAGGKATSGFCCIFVFFFFFLNH